MEPKEMKRITLCSVILWTLSVMAAEAQVCSPGHRQEGGGISRYRGPHVYASGSDTL